MLKCFEAATTNNKLAACYAVLQAVTPCVTCLDTLKSVGAQADGATLKSCAHAMRGCRQWKMSVRAVASGDMMIE